MLEWSDYVAIGALLTGFPYALLSLWIRKDYNRRTGKKPPSVQLWSRNNEIRERYPRLSLAGQRLEIAFLVMLLPYLFYLFFLSDHLS